MCWAQAKVTGCCVCPCFTTLNVRTMALLLGFGDAIKNKKLICWTIQSHSLVFSINRSCWSTGGGGEINETPHSEFHAPLGLQLQPQMGAWLPLIYCICQLLFAGAGSFCSSRRRRMWSNIRSWLVLVPRCGLWDCHALIWLKKKCVCSSCCGSFWLQKEQLQCY